MEVLRFIPSETFKSLIQIDFDLVTLPQNLQGLLHERRGLECPENFSTVMDIKYVNQIPYDDF